MIDWEDHLEYEDLIGGLIDWEDPLEYKDLIDGLIAWCKYALPDETP